MQVNDEIFDEKYYIYYYDGDIKEAIEAIQWREDINDVIQTDSLDRLHRIDFF